MKYKAEMSQINKTKTEYSMLYAQYTAMADKCNMLYAENDELYNRLDNLEKLFGVYFYF